MRKTIRLEPRQSLGTSNLAWGGTMFQTGRFSVPGLAGILVAALVAAGCSSQSGPAFNAEPVASAAGASAPVVLTGASLLIDGDAPRLLLSAEGPLQPMVYAREGSRTLVVDLPGTVASPGLEPPRADGKLLTHLDMRSFTELGRPQIRFELTGRGALDAKISGDPASRAMTVALIPRIDEPVVAQAASAGDTPASVAESLPEPSPVQRVSPVPVIASTAGRSEPVLVAQHAAVGRPATRLARVDARRVDGALSVKLEGDGELSYEAFTLSNPPRFVLDLSGVQNASRFRAQDVDSGGVTRVRVSQFRTEPTAVTRVVFDLAEESLPTLRQSASGVQVSFAGRIEAPAASVQVASATPAPIAPVPAAPAAGSYEAHEADDADQPVVEASRPEAVAEARPVVVVEPPVVAPETETAPRLVAAAAPPIPAEPERPVEPVVAAAATEPLPAAPAPAPAAAAVRSVPVAPVPTRLPEAVAVSSPEVAVIAPASPARTTRKRVAAEDTALLEAAETLAVQQEKDGQPRDISNPFESRAIGQTERQYTGEPLTLNLKDADIKDTLQKFSELTNLNIVLDPDVRGTVTVSLTDIPWDQALELILKINGLGYVLEGNVMRIAGTQKLASEETGRQSLLKAQENNRPTKTVIQKLSYATADAAAATAKKVMSARGDIFVDSRSNLLIIRELPEYLPTVLDLIKSLDTAVPQVMIEARIVEATRTFSRRLGISWGFNAVADQTTGNTTGLIFPNNGSVAGTVSLPNGAEIIRASLGNVLDTFRLDMALSAAEARGLVKIVSSPKILTQTNKSASVQSGFQIPVQTTVNNTTTVLYIDATLRLDVTPQITAEGTVILDIKIQRREPAPGTNVTGGQNVPLITRDATTTLMVRDGGTGMIAGIFKLTANDGQNMIPGLWKIPLLGGLFRNKTTSEETDELMIFITPRIMKAL
ncbi:MAG: type IV pilus secretin PilQ [Holophagales bacterium]|nr:type IV pilus secretin PilQ [Holophagales bacterium]